MATEIHKQAIVDAKARLDTDVFVGPYSIIDGDVEIGSGTRINSHAVIKNGTRLGKNNLIYPFVTLGDAPADLKYGGEKTYLEIGDKNTLREGCMLHRGTAQGAKVTRMGSNNLIMPYCHIGHDCNVGNSVILGFTSALAGHVQIGDFVNLNAGVKVVQHRRIGAHAYITADMVVRHDVPAFIMVDGGPRAVNRVGMERAGFSAKRIATIREAYRIVYLKNLTLEKSVEELKLLKNSDDIQCFIDSITGHDGRGILRTQRSNKTQA